MTARIKYTVKYHPRQIKKVAKVLFVLAVLLLLICNLIWVPFSSLPLDMQALSLVYILPKILFDLTNVALLAMSVSGILWLFKWRSGEIELTDDRLIIHGSYYVSIWYENMWEVNVRDFSYHRRRIMLDSNTDAVHIKFRTEEEFQNISEKLIQLVGHIENIKLNTIT